MSFTRESLSVSTIINNTERWTRQGLLDYLRIIPRDNDGDVIVNSIRRVLLEPRDDELEEATVKNDDDTIDQGETMRNLICNHLDDLIMMCNSNYRIVLATVLMNFKERINCAIFPATDMYSQEAQYGDEYTDDPVAIKHRLKDMDGPEEQLQGLSYLTQRGMVLMKHLTDILTMAGKTAVDIGGYSIKDPVSTNEVKNTFKKCVRLLQSLAIPSKDIDVEQSFSEFIVKNVEMFNAYKTNLENELDRVVSSNAEIEEVKQRTEELYRLQSEIEQNLVAMETIHTTDGVSILQYLNTKKIPGSFRSVVNFASAVFSVGKHTTTTFFEITSNLFKGKMTRSKTEKQMNDAKKLIHDTASTEIVEDKSVREIVPDLARSKRVVRSVVHEATPAETPADVVSAVVDTIHEIAVDDVEHTESTEIGDEGDDALLTELQNMTVKQLIEKGVSEYSMDRESFKDGRRNKLKAEIIEMIYNQALFSSGEGGESEDTDMSGKRKKKPRFIKKLYSLNTLNNLKHTVSKIIKRRRKTKRRKHRRNKNKTHRK